MAIQLSFIMPTYNSAEYISETLDSLLYSIGDYKDECEVICVDDGSSDTTVQILERYRQSFPSLNIIKNKHGGVSVARNTALNQVKGVYLTFVDSDDLFDESFVSYFFSIQKNFDVMFTDVEKLESVELLSDLNEDEKLEIFKATLGIGEYKIHPGVAGKIFKTSLIQKHQLRYNEKLSTAEDILFNFSALTKCNTVRLDTVSFYIVNGTHSLMFFNEKNLSGQLEFVQQTRMILSTFHPSENTILVEQVVILKAMSVFIDRYIGPLWENNTYTLSQAATFLKRIIEENDFHDAFRKNNFDNAFGTRYVIFRKLLRYHLYSFCLIFNKMMDKVKKYDRFREK